MQLTTSGVVDRLRGEGWQITVGYLAYLLRECPLLRPETRAGQLYLWQPADIERLKVALRDRGRGPVPRVGQPLPPQRGGQP